MKHFHDGIAERWFKLTTMEQLANVGAEVGRAAKWKSKNKEIADNAFYRGLELLDCTIDDPKNADRLSEILRVREVFCDFYAGDNIYGESEASWNKYFMYFSIAART